MFSSIVIHPLYEVSDCECREGRCTVEETSETFGAAKLIISTISMASIRLPYL